MEHKLSILVLSFLLVVVSACTVDNNDEVSFNGNESFFAFRNYSTDGSEMWVSDGTAERTHILKDVNLLNLSILPSYHNYSVFNQKLYFVADDGLNGYELWVTNGSEYGTRLLKDINNNSTALDHSNSMPLNFTIFKNKLFFTAYTGIYDWEVWFTDGTEEGTKMLKDINPFNNDQPGRPKFFKVFNDRLYFIADDGVHGQEIWVTDGTEEGTVLLKDINVSDNGSFSFGIPDFTVFNNRLYFAADDGINGVELWVTDGTENGTSMLKDINPGIYSEIPQSGSPRMFQVFNDQLFFVAYSFNHGFELWKTDGTEAGTTIFKEIYTDPMYLGGVLAYGQTFAVLNNKMYFQATDGIHGYELWATDGTADGTMMVKNINATDEENSWSNGTDSSIGELTVFNNKIYFSADDGVHGVELWFSDGTENGTMMLKDIRLGNEFTDSYPKSFLVFNEQLFFITGISDKLWVSDGTEVGTQEMFNSAQPSGINADFLMDGVLY